MQQDAAANLHIPLILFLLLRGSCLLLEQIRVRVQQRIVASLELPINLSDLQCNHDVSFTLHVPAWTQATSCIQGTGTGKGTGAHTHHFMCNASPSARAFNGRLERPKQSISKSLPLHHLQEQHPPDQACQAQTVDS